MPYLILTPETWYECTNPSEHEHSETEMCVEIPADHPVKLLMPDDFTKVVEYTPMELPTVRDLTQEELDAREADRIEGESINV